MGHATSTCGGGVPTGSSYMRLRPYLRLTPTAQLAALLKQPHDCRSKALLRLLGVSFQISRWQRENCEGLVCCVWWLSCLIDAAGHPELL